jgi:hypothetical protein
MSAKVLWIGRKEEGVKLRIKNVELRIKSEG